MKRILILSLFVILVASIIAVAIIYYSVHWILLVLLAVFLALFVAYMFLSMKFQELIEWLIWPRGIQSTDDRGNAVELRDIKKMPSGSQITKQELDEARKKARTLNLSSSLLWFLPVILIFIGVIVAHYFFGVAIPSWLNWINYVVMFALGFLSLRFFKVAVLKWQAGGLVAINRCASCRYNLQELPAADDGCTICPECGAAW